MHFHLPVYILVFSILFLFFTFISVYACINVCVCACMHSNVHLKVCLLRGEDIGSFRDEVTGSGEVLNMDPGNKMLSSTRVVNTLYH